jgi:glycosyltransferase involved in cell wall biosynthesis
MISAALCVFNGERFLNEQLASMLAQTKHIDELVICDDGSTDGTLHLLQSFAQNAPFPVHIHQNTRQFCGYQQVNIQWPKAIVFVKGAKFAF